MRSFPSLTVPRLATVASRWLRGPCAACGRTRGAPLCETCSVASATGTHTTVRLLDGIPLHFAGAYHGAAGGLSPLGRAIVAFKDRGDRYAGRHVCRLASGLGDALPAKNALLVPVPSEISRLRQRGFSAAAWLAAALSKRSGLGVAASALERMPGRPPQRGLGGAARRRNVRGAFALGRAPVRGYAVVLVDDVATTGATLREAASCLERGGARVAAAVVLACADEKVTCECRSTTGPVGTRSTAAPAH